MSASDHILLRSSSEEEISPEMGIMLGKALAMDHKCIVVARDITRSSAVMAESVISGLLFQGADVIDLGLTSAPAAAMYASKGDCAVYVAGKPGKVSGFYLLNPDGSIFSDEQIRHLDLIFQDPPNPPSHKEIGRYIRKTGITDEYNRTLENNLAKGVKCSVVLDCKCGITADSIPQILNSMGADVLAINCQKDLDFHSYEKKAESQAMRDVEDIVASSLGSIGIRMNSIGTSAEVIDEQGKILPPDKVFSLLLMYLRPAKVAVTLNSSSVIEDAFFGRIDADINTPNQLPETQEFILTKDNVADVCKAVADGADIGYYHGTIVFSGGAAVGDGMRAVISIVEMAGENSLHKLSEQLPEYHSMTKDIECPFKADKFKHEMDDNLQDLSDSYTQFGNSYRIVLDHGWFAIKYTADKENGTIGIIAESKDTIYLLGLMEMATELVERVVHSD